MSVLLWLGLKDCSSQCFIISGPQFSSVLYLRMALPATVAGIAVTSMNRWECCCYNLIRPSSKPNEHTLACDETEWEWHSRSKSKCNKDGRQEVQERGGENVKADQAQQRPRPYLFECFFKEIEELKSRSDDGRSLFQKFQRPVEVFGKLLPTFFV